MENNIEDILYQPTFLFKDMVLGKKYRIIGHKELSLNEIAALDGYLHSIVVLNEDGHIVTPKKRGYWSKDQIEEQLWIVEECNV